MAATEDVLRRMVNEPDFLDRFLESPEEALADYELSPEEREALISGDFGQIAGLDRDLMQRAVAQMGDKCPARSRS